MALLMTLFLDYVFALLVTGVPLSLKVLNNPAAASRISFLHDYLLNPIRLIRESFQTPIFVKAQLVFLALFLFLFGKKLWQGRKHKAEDASDYAAYGSARYATDEEIENHMDFSIGFENEGTIVGLHKGKPVVHHMKSFKNRNVALFGKSGSQKTKSYIIPNILNTTRDSLVVTDPKGELYRDTADIKRKQGYRVLVLNFKNPYQGMRINPLDYVNHDTDALRIGQALLNNSTATGGENKFWEMNEAILIASVILYVKYFLPPEQQNLTSVFNILNCTIEEIGKLFEPIDERHIVKKKFRQFMSFDEKTRSILWGSSKSAIDLWSYEEISKLTCTSDFRIEDIGKEKTILYILVPSADRTKRPLSSTLFYLLFAQLKAEAEKFESIRLPVSVRFLIDEFANIGRISSFDEELSVCRSYGIFVTIAIQSLSQLEKDWGANGRKEIIDNCDIRLFLGSNDYDSTKYFSDLLGTTTMRIKNESETESGNGTSMGESYSYIQRNLETPDELNRKADDTLIVFVPGSHPLKLKKAYYTHIPEIKALMESASLSNIFEFQREDDDYSEFIPQEALALLEKEESQQQEEPQEENKEKRQENEEALPYWD